MGHLQFTVNAVASEFKVDPSAVVKQLMDRLSATSTSTPAPSKPAKEGKRKASVAVEEEEAPPRWPYLAGCQHMFDRSPKIGVICGASRKEGSIYCSRHVKLTPDGQMDNTPPSSHHLAFVNRAIGQPVHAITGFVLDKLDKKLVIGRYFRDESRVTNRVKLDDEGYHALIPEDAEEIAWWKLKCPPGLVPEPDPEPEPELVMSPSKRAKNTNKEPEPVIVFCDGACPNNGAGATVAGAGVWFGENDPRNLAEKVPGQPTNNRAEMWAAIRALEVLKEEPWVRIVTDSQLLVNSMTAWLPKWIAKDFKGVSNTDLIRRLVELTKDRKVEWQHTPGHAGVLGNERADQLARSACEVARPAQAPVSSQKTATTNVAALKERLKVLNTKGGTKAKAKVGASEPTQPEEPKTKTKIVFTVDDSDDEE